MNPKIKNLLGKRFGRLTVLKLQPHKRGQARWICSCECGTFVSVVGASLRNGATQSCGCLRLERLREALVTHGHARKGNTSAEYKAYHAMKKRCLDPKDKEYKNYGARGISICHEWLNGDGQKSGFEVFLSEMGSKPSSNYTLDRVENSKGYSASNCRWATPKDQARNRRNTAKDSAVTVAEIAAETGIRYHTLMDRFRRGDRGDLLIRPIRPNRRWHRQGSPA